MIEITEELVGAYDSGMHNCESVNKEGRVYMAAINKIVCGI